MEKSLSGPEKSLRGLEKSLSDLEKSLSGLSELQRLVLCDFLFLVILTIFVTLIIYNYKQGIVFCIARILFQTFSDYGCPFPSSLYPFHISHFTFLRKFCSPGPIPSKAQEPPNSFP